MDYEILENIKKFIEKERWKYPFELNEQTRLEQDLKIYGDDADEFLRSFGKKFNVDVSKFSIADYFSSEGDKTLSNLLQIITGKKRKILKPLTLGHLVKSIKIGKLNEEIINK